MVLVKIRRRRSLPSKHRSQEDQLIIRRRLLYLIGALLILGFASLIVLSKKQNISLKNIIPHETKVSAISNGIIESENKLKQKQIEIDETNKSIEKLSSETIEINEKKQEIINESASLQSQIDSLKDNFVTITSYAPGSEGNSYAPGNCTWYVKEKRPDIPNNLGNANQWYNNAKLDGFKVGAKPKVGAIGVSYEGDAGHVVYVESLRKSDVVVSEMNYGGLWNKNKRQVSSSSFIYIYNL